MELAIFIIGLSICSLLVGIWLYYKMHKKGVNNVFFKIFASLSFVVFAVLLSAIKANVAFYGNYAVAMLIIGMICGLVGDILFEFKNVYSFHDDKFLTSGLIAFIIEHFCYVVALVLLACDEILLQSFNYILPTILIFVGSIIATIILWIVFHKVYNLNFKGKTLLVNIYNFFLIFASVFGLYLAFVLTNVYLFILAMGLVVFVAGYFVLLFSFYGRKESTNAVAFSYAFLYYAAQIIISSFIFFV